MLKATPVFYFIYKNVIGIGSFTVDLSFSLLVTDTVSMDNTARIWQRFGRRYQEPFTHCSSYPMHSKVTEAFSSSSRKKTNRVHI